MNPSTDPDRLGLYYALFLLDLVLHALVFMARVSAISPPLKKRLIQKMNYLFLTTIYVSSHPSINLSMLWTGHSGTIIFTGFGFVICLSGCFMTSNIILVFKYSRFTIHLSQNTRLMHEQLTRVSFLQFTFLFFTCQLPFILAVVISASFGDNFGWLATSLGVLTNFHYSGNCLLVLAFTKFYREWLKNFFRQKVLKLCIWMETRNLRRRRQEYGLLEANQDVEPSKHKPPPSMPILPTIIFLMSMFIFIIVVLGYATTEKTAINDLISRRLMENIDVDNIKNYLRELTKEPHVAGTDENRRVAEAIARIWTENGLEGVHFNSYNVLLNYPVWEKPNTLKIHKGFETFYQTNGTEPMILPDEQGDPFAGIQWLAWSPPGQVTGDIVFCNEARDSDFQTLKELEINVTGKIALIRYGTGFRGDKVKRAQHEGATAVLLYSDPAEVAAEGIDEDKVYPHTAWMPHEGVQRGSIIHGMFGDPLTPVLPSKPGIYRSRDIEQAKLDGILPSIPALPISYTTAFEIMKRMNGPLAPKDWQGGLKLDYRLGPGLDNDAKVTLEVHSIYETKTINNVLGYIKGAEEPDRFVILGNHYDAWVYGSLDPNSGTAILAEIANSFTKTIKETSWRPARTIFFAAWDAEEYSLIGSTEFVEEYLQMLQQRAVTYINMDCIHDNKTLTLATTPSLHDVVIQAAKRIPNPSKEEQQQGRPTLYDTWYHYYPDEKYKHRPWMKIPSGNSDQAPFQNFAGIPVIDFAFKNNSPIDYPLYHSMYETPFLNEHLVDWDNFAIHLATGKLWIELARSFSESEILPINHLALAEAIIDDYIPPVQQAVNSIKPFDQSAEAAIVQLSDQVHHVQQMSLTFKETILEFTAKFSKAKNRFERRSINDRIMAVDRCFINPVGMLGAPQSRHVLFSLNVLNASKSVETFLEDAKISARQISIVHYSILCATNAVKEFF
ncbi:unnamed protein product, partial [Mesorhabditis belari]|uniref:N-acetylated-alpha-linked acidic dipeptidase 2 n=1 Tax=Mesorhabditis belari TaxID=2138241 RepID=A0AAF3FS34_9BILA